MVLVTSKLIVLLQIVRLFLTPARVNFSLKCTRLKVHVCSHKHKPAVANVHSLALFNAELSPEMNWRGPRCQDVEERGRLYLTLHCHHHNDSCIRMGSDESHSIVSLIVRDKVIKSVYKPQPLKRDESRRRIEPRPFCLPALPLGHTGSCHIGNKV